MTEMIRDEARRNDIKRHWNKKREGINETKNEEKNSEHHKIVVNSPALYRGGSYLESYTKRSH
jgi:hypothetical protein